MMEKKYSCALSVSRKPYTSIKYKRKRKSWDIDRNGLCCGDLIPFNTASSSGGRVVSRSFARNGESNCTSNTYIEKKSCLTKDSSFYLYYINIIYLTYTTLGAKQNRTRFCMLFTMYGCFILFP